MGFPRVFKTILGLVADVHCSTTRFRVGVIGWLSEIVKLNEMFESRTIQSGSRAIKEWFVKWFGRVDKTADLSTDREKVLVPNQAKKSNCSLFLSIFRLGVDFSFTVKHAHMRLDAGIQIQINIRFALFVAHFFLSLILFVLFVFYFASLFR